MLARGKLEFKQCPSDFYLGKVHDRKMYVAIKKGGSGGRTDVGMGNTNFNPSPYLKVLPTPLHLTLEQAFP